MAGCTIYIPHAETRTCGILMHDVPHDPSLEALLGDLEGFLEVLLLQQGQIELS